MDPAEQDKKDLERAIQLLADIYSGGYDAKMITRTAFFLAEMNAEFYAGDTPPEEN